MPKPRSQKIIFILLCFEGALISFNIAAIAAVIPQIASDLSRDSFKAARLISFYMVPYGLAALVYAPLLKKYPLKPIKLICLFIFALASFVSGLANSLPVLFLSRALAGIAASATIPVGLILIGELAKKEARGRKVGVFFSITFISSLCGLFLSGILSWRQLFIIPGIFAIIGLGLVSAFFDFKSAARYDFEVNYLHLLKDAGILKIFSYIFILSLIYHGLYNWLGVYLAALNYSQLKISLLLSLAGFSGIFGQLLGGWVTDKKGRVFAASLGLILFSCAAILLTKPFSLDYLAGALFIFGTGWTINHNAVSTVLTDFPDKFRPALAGLNSAVRFASGGLGVYGVGIFMQKSFSLTFLGLGLIVLLLALATEKILRFY